MFENERCKYLSDEIIGFAKGLQGPWPLRACEAPDDGPKPSFASDNRVIRPDDTEAYYCRLATSTMNKCSGFKPLVEQ